MAVNPTWNPVNIVGMPSVSGASVSSSLAQMGKGFSDISNRIQVEKELAAKQKIADQELGLKQDELNFKLSAPERELKQAESLFNLQTKQAKSRGSELADISSGLGGSLFSDIKANTNFDEVFQGVPEWEGMSKEQKQQTTTSLLSDLQGNKRYTSDPDRVRATARENYLRQGVTDPTKLDDYTKQEVTSIFGTSATPEQLKLLAGGKEATMQDKIMLEMVKNQGKQLNEGNYRQTDEFVDKWMKDKHNLSETRTKHIFGLFSLPDVGNKELYRDNVRKLIAEGVARGIPATGTLGAVDGFISDGQTPGIDLMNMQGDQKDNFWATAANVAGQQQGGMRGELLNHLTGGQAQPSMSLSELLAASGPTRASKDDLNQFFMQQFQQQYPSARRQTAQAAPAAPAAGPQTSLLSPQARPAQGNESVVSPADPTKADPNITKVFSSNTSGMTTPERRAAKQQQSQVMNAAEKIFDTIKPKLEREAYNELDFGSVNFLRSSPLWDDFSKFEKQHLLDVLRAGPSQG